MEREDDEIDAIQDACSLPRDLEEPQYKANEGDNVGARIYDVHRSLKMQLQLASDVTRFLKCYLKKKTFFAYLF